MPPSVNWRIHCLGFVALLLCNLGLWAQTDSPLHQLVQAEIDNGTFFSPVKPFTIIHTKSPDAVRVAPHAQFLTLNLSELQQINMARHKAISLDLPFRNEHLLLDLVRTEITTDDFSVVNERNELQHILPGVHYRGTLHGQPNSIVAISFFDDEVIGLVVHPQMGNMVLGKLDIRGNTEQYILYEERDMQVQNPFGCHVTEQQSIGNHENPNAPEVNGCVRVYIEADNELFTDKGSSVQATVNYLMGMYNQVITLYSVEQINTVVSQLFIWTTPDIYPTSSSAAALDAFRSFRTSFNGDLAHLIGTGGNNLGGIAYLDVLCASAYARAFSDIATSYSTVPTYSWTIEVVTHEMGHNLGAHHTQWCGWQGGPIDGCVSPEGTCSPGPLPTNGGTIMSYCHLTGYGINFNNGFGPQPGNTIRSEVSTATCLSASCASSSSCGAPTDISVGNITGSTAVITWGAISGASSYVLRYRAVGAPQWVTMTGVSSPYTISGLPSNDEIEVTIQSVCGGTSSAFLNGVLFKTGTGSGGATCGTPAGLSAAPAATSATVTWGVVSGAASYNISWKDNASGTWGTNVSVASTTYNITGLTAATAYNVRVQAVCSGSSSTYTTANFTTLSASGCNIPTNLAASPTASSALVSWSAVSGAASYRIQWKANSAATWGGEVTVSSTNYTISGLSAATTYNVRVRTACASGFSNYVTTNFTTLSSGGSCGTPSNLTGTTTANSANMYWTTVPGATNYSIQWKLSTTNTWSSLLTVGSAAYTITGLSASSSYNVRVQANCSSGASAFITTTVNTQAGSGCNMPTGLSAINITATSVNVLWNAASGALDYTIQIKRDDQSTWLTFNNLPVTSVMVQSLTPSTTYNVRVRSNCSGGAASAYTAIVNFTTAANMPFEIQDNLHDLSDRTQVLTYTPDLSFNIAPNPVSDRVRFILETDEDIPAQLTITDSYGRQVVTQEVMFSAGMLEWDVSDLPAGIYFTGFSTANMRLKPGKFVIRR